MIRVIYILLLSVGFAGIIEVPQDRSTIQEAPDMGAYEYCEYECDVELGDLTGNGEINILDVVQSINMVLELSAPNYPCAADFNEDDEINILDIMQIAYYILKN